MFHTALLATLCVFVCFGGNWLWGQTMIERPLIVGTIAGLIFGDVHTGILMGQPSKPFSWALSISVGPYPPNP